VAYFEDTEVARRYARHRPDVHPAIVRLIEAMLGPAAPVARGLDVGCGTGQSTRALARIAEQVIGIDVSRGMLAAARAEAVPRVDYAQAAAERLPFPGEAFDLLSAGLAFHWFDQPRFLAEARRVLTPAGWLVVSNSAFRGEMRENPEFRTWTRERYLARYPTPPRNRPSLAPEAATEHGFRLVKQERFDNEVPFAVDGLVGYLLTQSNIIAAVEQGRESLAEARAWLTREVEPLFPDTRATFVFDGAVWILRRDAAG
jgi:ubiquinone/menaquinone biosynthesis C-methylase UbiE